jgi:hypothetical protein
MPTFKITAKMTTTGILVKSINAKNLEEATARVLLNAKSGD